MNPNSPKREDFQVSDNPIGMDGIVFIEYTTSKPQTLAQVLDQRPARLPRS